jgi:hypothetical protein
MTKSDCLICLFPARGHFRPPLDCACRPVVHRACWEKWTTFSGSTCLICRFNPNPPILLLPQNQEQVIYVYHQHQLLGVQRFLYFLVAVGVLFVLAMLSRRSPMLGIQRGAEL